MEKNVPIGGIVVSAGLSSRMGDFKPLLPLGRKTIIENTVDRLLEAGISAVSLVVGYKGNEVEALFKKRNDSRIHILYNTEYQTTDMLHSIKIALKDQQEKNMSAAFILPGDLPAVQKGTFLHLIDRYKKENPLLIFPTLLGRKKHPPLLDASCFEHVINYKGSGGLRAALELFSESTLYTEINDIGCSMDADTPEQYKALLDYFKSANL